ncbi:CO dehydrogenase/acetyl-CoA synthase delta subunit [Natronincola peptidivorans]|uniref:CO dehydrogenase/acetyl-CoA synthase delta subunit n=2 Tax=Natronincola peptidivorans TaxID=426128 RepID=A0A1I0CAX9_9FIRM|nr:CO dehydrogenase/acetyl-CoA synthase delta subunit [Natronincola peptidivorans]
MNEKEEVISNKRIQHALDGVITSSVGEIPVIKSQITMKDTLGGIGVRAGINRNNYKVPIGMYAVGKPTGDSPVLVTGNYKLTVDALRKELTDLDVWMMVIDTKGVNIWCAAGKGTFSTEEIIFRIKKNKLEELVNHKRIILPQLGASGVVAHEIYKHSGFKVIYGPIRAESIKDFLANNEATEEMRKVTFHLKERLTVSVLETVYGLKYCPIIFTFFMLLQLFSGEYTTPVELLFFSLMNTLPYLGAILMGTIGLAAMLPILPFRMFSMKALILGLIWSGIVIANNSIFLYGNNAMVLTGHMLLLTSITTFLGLNFTGSSTYTSLSGVLRETVRTVSAMAVTSIVGLLLLIIDVFI